MSKEYITLQAIKDRIGTTESILPYLPPTEFITPKDILNTDGDYCNKMNIPLMYLGKHPIPYDLLVDDDVTRRPVYEHLILGENKANPIYPTYHAFNESWSLDYGSWNSTTKQYELAGKASSLYISSPAKVWIWDPYIAFRFNISGSAGEIAPNTIFEMSYRIDTDVSANHTMRIHGKNSTLSVTFSASSTTIILGQMTSMTRIYVDFGNLILASPDTGWAYDISGPALGSAPSNSHILYLTSPDNAIKFGSISVPLKVPGNSEGSGCKICGYNTNYRTNLVFSLLPSSITPQIQGMDSTGNFITGILNNNPLSWDNTTSLLHLGLNHTGTLISNKTTFSILPVVIQPATISLVFNNYRADNVNRSIFSVYFQDFPSSTAWEAVFFMKNSYIGVLRKATGSFTKLCEVYVEDGTKYEFNLYLTETGSLLFELKNLNAGTTTGKELINSGVIKGLDTSKLIIIGKDLTWADASADLFIHKLDITQ